MKLVAVNALSKASKGQCSCELGLHVVPSDWLRKSGRISLNSFASVEKYARRVEQ